MITFITLPRKRSPPATLRPTTSLQSGPGCPWKGHLQSGTVTHPHSPAWHQWCWQGSAQKLVLSVAITPSLPVTVPTWSCPLGAPQTSLCLPALSVPQWEQDGAFLLTLGRREWDAQWECPACAHTAKQGRDQAASLCLGFLLPQLILKLPI